MKRIQKLFIPDWSAWDTIWGSPLPFCLWPMGNQALLGHWMDRAVADGVDEVQIYTADRPAETRAYLRGGAYWSKAAKVFPIRSDDHAPEDATPLLGLPESNRLEPPMADPASLLRRWLNLNCQWLESLNDYDLTIERRHASGGWIGPRCRIHPAAKLNAPFWIEGWCEIGPEAEVGPYACIGKSSVIDAGAAIRRGILLPGTALGQNTQLEEAGADGGILLDIKRGCRVAIADDFILGKLDKGSGGVSWRERLFAAGLLALLSPFALAAGRSGETLRAHDGAGGTLALEVGKRGPLVLRRWSWLKHVARGRMRLVGVLPRPVGWKLEGNCEIERRLLQTAPGVVSLADAFGCHSPGEPEEWLHASYQALSAGGGLPAGGQGQYLKTLFAKSP